MTFNPLPSHEGRRSIAAAISSDKIFQSTSLSRGKTLHGDAQKIWGIFQSTSLSRGKTGNGFGGWGGNGVFQSTSLSRGKTRLRFVRHLRHIFQSTSLSRGKTNGRANFSGYRSLSIHFPLTREDVNIWFAFRVWNLSIHFPLTREDDGACYGKGACGLSIHFPLTREDLIADYKAEHGESFNPLPSHEGRRTKKYWQTT